VELHACVLAAVCMHTCMHVSVSLLDVGSQSLAVLRSRAQRGKEHLSALVFSLTQLLTYARGNTDFGHVLDTLLATIC